MARALDLHSRGQGFDSLILHKKIKKTEYRRRKTEEDASKWILKAWKGKTFTEIMEQKIRLVPEKK